MSVTSTISSNSILLNNIVLGGVGTSDLSSVYTSIHFGLTGDSITTTAGDSGAQSTRVLDILLKRFGDIHEGYTSGLSGGFLTDIGEPASKSTMTIFNTSPTGFAYNAPRSDQLPVIVIHCATNDFAASVSVEDCYTALLATLESIKASGIWPEVFYSTMIPRGGLETVRDTWNQYLIDHIDELRAAGLSGSGDNTQGLLLVDESSYFDAEGDVDLLGYRTDEIHPSDRGNAFIANCWLGQMMPVLRRYPNLRYARRKPWDIPGVKVILTADSGITTSGSSVTEWLDTRTANGWKVAQATGSRQPTYNAAQGPFGLPVVSFDGGDCLDAEAAMLASGFSNGKGKLSIITATKIGAIPAGGTYSNFGWVGLGSVSTANARIALGMLGPAYNARAAREDATTAGNISPTVPVPETMDWHVHSQHNDYDNDFYQRFIDGVNVGGASAATTKGKITATNSLVVRVGAGGSAASPSAFFTGDMYGIIFGDDLTMGEMMECHHWLNDEMQGACYQNWGGSWG